MKSTISIVDRRMFWNAKCHFFDSRSLPCGLDIFFWPSCWASTQWLSSIKWLARGGRRFRCVHFCALHSQCLPKAVVLGHVTICRLWVRHSPCCKLFLINCFGIEMVLCDLYLKRCDLTKGLSCDTFSITVWYKLCHHDHSVLRVRIVFTTNELVDRTRNFKSNASRCKQKIWKKCEKNAPQARFLWNKMRRRQDFSNKMRRRPDFLTKS